MSIISKITNKILNNSLIEINENDLNKTLEQLFVPNVDNILKSSLLTAINFTRDDDYALLIRCLIKVLKQISEQCPLNFPVYDIVGTGGDKKNTYNISTPASIICAGSGIKICKHGNRSSTSNSGSADVLEELGANINLNSSQIQEIMENNNFCFIYAPQFYKKMKHIMPVRKSIGIKTIFNFIGPLINPTNPTGLLIGVSDINKAEIIAKSLAVNPKTNVMLVHSNGIDKISPYKDTKYWKINNREIRRSIIKPTDFGLNYSDSDDYFKGGIGKFSNARKILEILMNLEQGPIKDFVLVHSATLAVLSNKVSTFKEGMELMKKNIESGEALRQLNNYVKMSNKFSKEGFLDRIMNRKKVDLSIKIQYSPINEIDSTFQPLNCYEILSKKNIKIIGEIKRSSPSEGSINSNININEVVTDYINGNVVGISILTENVWFDGSLDDIKSVRKQIENIPNRPFILRKDFIFADYQITESYNAGADTFLLIAGLEFHMIDQGNDLEELIKFAHSLEMEPIVEVANIDELIRSVNAGAKIIGINNRDLKTFNVTLETTEHVMNYVQMNYEQFKHVQFISLSGISSNNDINRLKKCNVNNFLIGTALMKSSNKTKFLKDLTLIKNTSKLVKICGITQRNELISVLYENVDMIGLMFYKHSTRFIGSIEKAKEFAKIIKKNNCRTVGVFVKQDFEEIKKIVLETGIDLVQLYGYSDFSIIQQLKELGVDIIWTISVENHYHFNKKEIKYPKNCSYICIDKKKGNDLGGTGERLDWNNMNLSKITDIPIIIAGGITPENVHLLKDMDNIYGIDVSTGVEEQSVKKIKDHYKIRKICRTVKNKLPSYFGNFGGCFSPEILMPSLLELEESYLKTHDKEEFKNLLKKYNKYAGRESLLYKAENLTEYVRKIANDCNGATIWLKREDMNHSGSHKINNSIGQALLAKYLGKNKIIAETGAGMAGSSVATVCALLGLEGKVFMGEIDVGRQKLNVFKMRALGTKVHAVTSGSKTLNSAVNAALRAWSSCSSDTHYLIGSAVGPHPYPTIVRDFQSIIGKEAKKQFAKQHGGLPNVVMACIGGGSNSLGMFDAFINSDVEIIGTEAAGCASLKNGTIGYLHGSKSLILQTKGGQIEETHSISSGLDYPGCSPILANLIDNGRMEVKAVNDEQALQGFDILCKTEGIIPALESSHVVYEAIQEAVKRPMGQNIIVCLSGRGDKDIEQINEHMNFV
tara:strand:+ start:1969 stop:5631 length:3663 start_codon:yes stop_codon:yes gene_type:complete